MIFLYLSVSVLLIAVFVLSMLIYDLKCKNQEMETNYKSGLKSLEKKLEKAQTDVLKVIEQKEKETSERMNSLSNIDEDLFKNIREVRLNSISLNNELEKKLKIDLENVKEGLNDKINDFSLSSNESIETINETIKNLSDELDSLDEKETKAINDVVIALNQYSKSNSVVIEEIRKSLDEILKEQKDLRKKINFFANIEEDSKNINDDSLTEDGLKKENELIEKALNQLNSVSLKTIEKKQTKDSYDGNDTIDSKNDSNENERVIFNEGAEENETNYIDLKKSKERYRFLMY